MKAFGRSYRSLARCAAEFGIPQQSLQFQVVKNEGDLEAAILHFRPDGRVPDIKEQDCGAATE